MTRSRGADDRLHAARSFREARERQRLWRRLLGLVSMRRHGIVVSKP
jgi:hypothetical protein